MHYIFEFEIYPDDGMYIAIPFELEGGTQGSTFEEACYMATDWLQTELEYRSMQNEPIPTTKLNHEPRFGGTVVMVSVKAGLDTIQKVSASDAARMLGVSPGRVTQMVHAGLLIAFKEGYHSWVTLDSVQARLAEQPHAGRPKRNCLVGE